MRTLVALSALVLVAGCQKALTEKDFYGDWTGKVVVKDQAAMVKKMTGLGLSEAMAKSAVEQAKGVSLSLTLKEDKSYSLSQGQGAVEGSWALAGDTVTLTPAKAMGMTKDDLMSRVPANMKSMIEDQFAVMSLKSDASGATLAGAAPGTGSGADVSFSKSAKK